MEGWRREASVREMDVNPRPVRVQGKVPELGVNNEEEDHTGC